MRIGIDLGGTNLAYGLVDYQGNIVKRGSYRLTNYNPSVIAEMMTTIYENYAAEHSIDLVGIGVPGIVSPQDGVVITCVNLGWNMVPLATYLKARIKCAVYIGNDANAACIGETLYGGMKGFKNAVLLTLGTGVGGGVISSGHLLTGFQGAGAEIGHMMIQSSGHICSCGNRGCLETVASASAITRHYNELSAAAPISDAKTVFQRHQEGDDTAIETVNWFVERFAVGIVNIYNIFAPEIIAIGGGVSHAIDIFLPKLEIEVEKRVFSKDIIYGRIVAAKLFNDAGIIGAAHLDQF